MNLSDLATSVKCAGKCGEEIDLMKTHLIVTVKPQKLALVIPAQTQRVDDDAVEDDEEMQVTVGSRAGVGDQLYFHNRDCAAKYFTDTKSQGLKLKINRDEDDPYSEGAEIMHGSDSEEGDES